MGSAQGSGEAKNARSSEGIGRLLSINSLVTLLLLTPLILPAVLTLVGLQQAHQGRRLPLASGLAQRIYTSDLRRIAQYDPSCFGPDPELLYAPKPGSHCRFENIEFRTQLSFDSLGGRGSEGDLSLPAVVVIGDSHAMGWGVEAEQSFAGRLRAAGIPTLTLAVSSYGTARELLLLERFAQRRPTDWAKVHSVVLQYTENDQEENAAHPQRYRPPATSVAEYAGLLEHSRRQGAEPPDVSAGLLLRPWFLRAALLNVPDTLRAETSEALRQLLPGRERAFQAKLDGGSRAAAASLLPVLAGYRRLLSGKQLLIVVSTSSGLSNASLAAAIDAALQRTGPALGLPSATVLDPLTACRRSCYFVLDDHPNVEGHRRIAAALEPLVRSGLSPSGAAQPAGSRASVPSRHGPPSGAVPPPPSRPPRPAAGPQDR